MEPINNQSEEQIAEGKFKKINTVTKTSKYLAMLLFILLPFVGGYIGYLIGTDNKMISQEISSVSFLESENAMNETEVDSMMAPSNPVNRDLELSSTELKPLFSLDSRNQNKIDCEIINEYSSWYIGPNVDDNECYQYEIGDGYKVIAEYAGCGGCSAFYRIEPDNSTITKLKNVPHFESVLFDRSPLTPYYIGMSWLEIFKYDFVTDSTKTIFSYIEDDNQSLLECGMGCSVPENVKVFVDNKHVYLTMNHFIFENEAQRSHMESPKKEEFTVLISE